MKTHKEITLSQVKGLTRLELIDWKYKTYLDTFKKGFVGTFGDFKITVSFRNKTPVVPGNPKCHVHEVEIVNTNGNNFPVVLAKNEKFDPKGEAQAFYVEVKKQVEKETSVEFDEALAETLKDKFVCIDLDAAIMVLV